MGPTGVAAGTFGGVLGMYTYIWASRTAQMPEPEGRRLQQMPTVSSANHRKSLVLADDLIHVSSSPTPV